MRLVTWRLAPDGAPEVDLECGHVVLVRPEWIAKDGKVGDLTCPECRRKVDGVVLAGWRGPEKP